jgi:hypothetical protein
MESICALGIQNYFSWAEFIKDFIATYAYRISWILQVNDYVHLC